MLNKRNFDVAAFCSKEESRYSLQGIQVTPEATVATDGHRLVWVSASPFKSEHYPQVQGLTASDTFTPFILARETAATVAKFIPKKTHIPVLANAGVSDGPDGTRMLAVTDLKTPQVWQTIPVEGKFPAYDYVIPKFEEAKYRICLNAEYLAQIAKFAAQFNDHSHAVVLSFYSDDKPVRFDAIDMDGQAMTAVCMPIRGTDDQPGTYGYADRVKAAKEHAEMIERMHVEAIEEDSQRQQGIVDAAHEQAIEYDRTVKAMQPTLYPDAATDTPDAWASVSSEVAEAFNISPEIATILPGEQVASF